MEPAISTAQQREAELHLEGETWAQALSQLVRCYTGDMGSGSEPACETLHWSRCMVSSDGFFIGSASENETLTRGRAGVTSRG